MSRPSFARPEAAPPLELPTPNAAEVAQFRSLFFTRFGVALTEQQADDQARRLVQFVFLTQHVAPFLRAARAAPEHAAPEHAAPEHAAPATIKPE